MIKDEDKEEYAHYASAWTSGKHPTKHNPSDFEAFERRQKRDRERSEIRYQQRMLEATDKNLRTWTQGVPARWKNADLSTMKSPHVSNLLDQINKKGFSSFFLYGGTGEGKTFHAYAIIKEYIRRGFCSPSQVIILNEGKLLDYINTGFDGRNQLSKVLSSSYKMYFFDDIGRGGSATEQKRNALWDRVVDHMYSNDVNFVMTSNFTMRGLVDNFSDAAFDRIMLKTMDRRIEFSEGNYRHRLAREEKENHKK